MAKGILSRINSAHVIATIALFAALGGGYASAFSGSGTLQKAALDGVSQTFEDARSLNGFGVLQARCDLADDEIEYQFVNTTTNHQVQIRGYFVDSGLDVFSRNALPGQSSIVIEPFDITGTTGSHNFRMHLFTFSDGQKRQVDLTANDLGPFDDDCSVSGDTFVRILALNTQE